MDFCATATCTAVPAGTGGVPGRLTGVVVITAGKPPLGGLLVSLIERLITGGLGGVLPEIVGPPLKVGAVELLRKPEEQKQE